MDLNAFNREWGTTDQKGQVKLLEQVSALPVREGIIPVMAGLTSFHFAVRNRAREILEIFQQRITEAFASEVTVDAIVDSTLISVHICEYIHANLSAQDMKLFLETLLEFGGRSPFYTWRLCQIDENGGKKMGLQALKIIASSVSDKGRLSLVRQYLAASPSLRREYAEPFIQMVREISDQNAVIDFYAVLFDHEVSADLFLENIKPALRDPNTLLAMALKSKKRSLSERNQALKAAAMLSESINPTLILKLISAEKAFELRKTTFKIVAQSPEGTYFQLTDTIIDALISLNPEKQGETLSKEENEARQREALEILKAAVISRGKNFPLHVLIHKVIQGYPGLLPVIQKELSSLSRVALVFIREMAEDTTGRLFYNSPVQHALICGLIRKRPERIISLLKQFKEYPTPRTRQGILRLVATLETRLRNEKEGLKKIFDPMIKRARSAKEKKENSGFFKSIFTTSLAQKIESVKTNDSPEEILFEDELLASLDLSFSQFLNPATFHRCVIRGGRMSFSSFKKCQFSETIFYRVKMEGAQFDRVHFNGCIFIDVFGERVNFDKCQFVDCSFFKSNFDSAVMRDAVFAGCLIAVTRFSRVEKTIAPSQPDKDFTEKEAPRHIKAEAISERDPNGVIEENMGQKERQMGGEREDFPGTDLSGASFVGSKIVYVSFENAKLSSTDFSGVTGKFCRFSQHSLTTAETEYSDLATKIFDLDTHVISPLLSVILQNVTIANALNMLLYTELIHQGKRFFLQKNRYALTVAFDLFQPEQADLFELIPLLIHENIDLYKPSARSRQLAQLVYDATWVDRTKRKKRKEIPHGISGYLPSAETEKIYWKYASDKYLDNEFGIIFKTHHHCAIEGLFTIGSIGSIAHTLGSDIDYWVCIRSVLFDDTMMRRLDEKLRAIESWAELQFKTEIHFFIVDIEDARRSIFGESDSESSGSAQGRLLKEEFYRTMIHVAGKLPFWVTLPSRVSKHYYHDLFIRTSPGMGSNNFIDFGDIHDIPTGEYFGASVWQMFKYLKSPFKSVLKMGLLERYIHEKREARMLLCNQFKDHWMTSGLQFSLIKWDPYYILMKSLVAFYEKNINKKSFGELVQSCFFAKIGIQDEKELQKSAFGLKRILVEKCIHEWGWEKEDVFHAGNVKNWSFRATFKESLNIERFMVRTYNSVRDALGVSTEQESLLTPRDRTVLGRKMFVQFNKEASKVKTVLLVSRKGLLSGMSLLYHQDDNKNPEWTLIHKWSDRDKGLEEVEKLKSASTIEEIAAWLIHNRLYSPETYIKLDPNPTHVRANDLRLLVRDMYYFFHKEMKTEASGDDLFNKSVVRSLFVSLNFTAPRDAKMLTECCAIYRNSWGEMFCHAMRLPQGMKTPADVIYKLKRDLDWQTVPERYKMFRVQN